MQTIFVFLDLENLAMADLGPLVGRSFRIKVFMGPHQTKVPLALARGLQAFGPNAEYIQMQGVGHNALDFHITYYLGRLAVQHPTARFVIVSKDSGFDPLIAHLRAEKISCDRVSCVSSVVPTKASDGKTSGDRLAVVIEDLTRRQGARPRTLKTLRSTVQALFHKQLNEDDLAGLLHKLSERGVINVENGKLTYSLPKQPRDGI